MMKSDQNHLNPSIRSMRWRWLNWPVFARRLAAGVYYLLLTWLLLAPIKSMPDVDRFFAHQDKLAHFVMFGLLSGIVVWAIPVVWGRGWRRLVMMALLMIYGIAIECVQPLMPGAGRSFEWLDMLFDGMGVVLGVWLCERLAQDSKPCYRHDHHDEADGGRDHGAGPGDDIKPAAVDVGTHDRFVAGDAQHKEDDHR